LGQGSIYQRGKWGGRREYQHLSFGEKKYEKGEGGKGNGKGRKRKEKGRKGERKRGNRKYKGKINVKGKK
jgi:hypothetical protein